MTFPPPPPYVEGHSLLEGKGVLVTAAAGTGIGFATAKRCMEEGARVVISDKHERRLGESAARARRARRPVRRHAGSRRAAAVRRRGVGARRHRRAREQRRPRRHRAAARDDRRAVARSCSTSRSTARSGARVPRSKHMYERGHRRDRQQRVGDRLAGAGGPGALRRGEGRRDGAHPLRGDRGRGHAACGSTRSRRASRCTRTWPRSPPRSCSRSSPTREAFGRWAEPWEVANVIVFLASDYSGYMTGEIVSVSSQHPNDQRTRVNCRRQTAQLSRLVWCWRRRGTGGVRRRRGRRGWRR